MPSGEVNYVHEAEIWRQALNKEVETAAVWHDNWGFLAGKEPGPPRGFSQNVAKYSHGAGNWTVSHVRVPDDGPEGMAAAESEQKARKLMSKLKYNTVPDTDVKPCTAKGVELVKDSKAGVETREAALLMRSFKFQSLGDACRTEGVDPCVKYTRPVLTSHEYGWRAPSTNGVNTKSLEMFGVAEHAKKSVVKKFN